MNTKLARLLLSLALLVLLAGCRQVVATTVRADGSAERSTQVIFSAEERQAFYDTPENAGKSMCASVNANVPDDSDLVFTEEQRADETYCVATQPFAGLADLRLAYALMDGVTVNELATRDGRFVFDLDVAASATGPNGADPIATEWHLTLPGTLGAHNAQRVEGQTLIWTIAPGQTQNLRAESSTGATLDPLLVAALVGLGLLAVLGTLAAFLMRRRAAPQT